MKRNKKLLLLLILAIFSGLFARDFDQDDYKIYHAASGEEISLEKMATQLADYDVIFFGEWHDDILLHKLQADILPLLDQNSDLTISMEMFERDVQPVLDDFLADKITQADFLKQSRAWGNYLTDYKPIIDYAKQNELDVIAANIPRRYASMISKQGVNALDKLSAEEKSYVAKELKALDNQYKKQFMETMAANMGRKNR